MKIMIAAGGTGGHIYPAVAFGRLASKEHETIFVGGLFGMEGVKLAKIKVQVKVKKS